MAGGSAFRTLDGRGEGRRPFEEQIQDCDAQRVG